MKRQYEIVTKYPGSDRPYQSDTVGLNEPRSLAQCKRDIAAFRRGECGDDFVMDDYYIRNVADNSIARRPGDRS